MSDPTKQPEVPALSREESAFFIKTIWEALLAPAWTRDDLIELGKVIFTKIPLNHLPDQTFSKLLPYLQTMANTMGKKILEQTATLPPSPPKKQIEDQSIKSSEEKDG
jgi:hypothetical protein